MRPKVTGAGLFRAGLLAAGLAVILIPRALWNSIILPSEIAADALIVFLAFRKGAPGSAYWRAAALALLAGDTLYFVNHNFPAIAEHTFALSEFIFTIFISSAFLQLWTLFRAGKPSWKDKAYFAGFAAAAAALSCKFVLFPYLYSGNYHALFYRLNSTYFRLTEACVLALAILMSVRTYSAYWLSLLHGLVLISIASLALGYNDGVLLGMEVPFHEYGWFWGLLLVINGQTFSDHGEKDLASWSSIRVQLGWLIFVFNLSLLLILYALGIILLKSAFQLTSLLFIVYGLWLISNTVAFYISGNVREILALLERRSALPKSAHEKLHFSELRSFADRLHTAYATIESQSKLAAIGEISAQVAHDIRSPLAALDSVSGDITGLPEEKKVILRSAMSRIRDIANSLVERTQRPLAAAGEKPVPRLVSALIEPVITEKRLQLRADNAPVIEFDASGSYGLFTAADPAGLKRVISNLLNNAAEAIPAGPGAPRGSIGVRVAGDEGMIVVRVTDSGKGIPAELLPRLFSRGETHDKAGGSGLGLYHAKKFAESCGGTAAISSRPGEGTAVTISLPKAAAPAWFVPAIEVRAGSTVAVLDDDESIHKLWQARLPAQGEGGPRRLDFHTAAEFGAWLEGSPAEGRGALFLLDYELGDKAETGLSLAKRFGIGRQSILVTSRHEEKEILAACDSLGMRVIPKNLCPLVPLRLQESLTGATAVLADDDPLVRLIWKTAAKEAGVDLRIYSGLDELFAGLPGLDKGCVFYLDSEFGAGMKGEDAAAKVKDAGFSEIWLETGHPPEKFSASPWLKIRGKEPPWMRD